MSHERSETMQLPSGKWHNVYGKDTPKAGERLPDTAEYDSVDEAVTAAKARSAAEGRKTRRSESRELRDSLKPDRTGGYGY